MVIGKAITNFTPIMKGLAGHGELIYVLPGGLDSQLVLFIRWLVENTKEEMMEPFEDIVRRYLENEGYWVRQSVKVHISREDKVAIGTYSMPTPEVDSGCSDLPL